MYLHLYGLMQINTRTRANEYNYALSQVFSSTLIKRLDDSRHEDNIKSLLYSSGLYPHDEKWDFVKGLTTAYEYLKSNYRCEYVYKNEIVNQLLLKYHKDNSATLLREVASDRSIADIVIINGETVAYEIKTELDKFDRLSGQLNSYQQLYDRLFIVTHPEAVNIVFGKIDESVGIIVLNNNNQLKVIRSAGSTKHLFNPAKAVLTLRQAELVEAYEKWIGKLPKMGTALIYEFCHEWYLDLDIEDAQIVFSEALKSRRPSTHQFSLIVDCDPSLRMLFCGRDLSRKNCIFIREKLNIFS